MGHDLVGKVQELSRLLELALTESGKRGKATAEAEREYAIERTKQILIERDNGMPATLINDIVKGRENIADLRFKRDVAQAEYKSAQEAINVYKLQIKTMDEQISREWHRA